MKLTSILTVVLLSFLPVGGAAAALSVEQEVIEYQHGEYIILLSKEPGRAMAVNDAGDVGGVALGVDEQPALWAGPNMAPALLDTLADSAGQGCIYAINNGGAMVGWSFNNAGHIRPTIWGMDGLPADADATSPYEAIAFGATDEADACGIYWIDPDGFAVEWTPHGVRPLGPEPACAYAINNRGLIVGKTMMGDMPVACLWDPVDGMVLLPTGPLPVIVQGEALGINDRGVIVGRLGAGVERDPLSIGVTDNNAPAKAALWEPGGNLMDLRALDDAALNKGCAFAVNLARQSVGYSFAGDGRPHACLWDAMGGVQDLNASLGGEDEIVLNVARDISDFGTIVGWAKKQEEECAAIMIPKQQYRMILYDPAQPDGEKVYSAGYQIATAGPDTDQGRAYVPGGMTLQQAGSEPRDVSLTYQALGPVGFATKKIVGYQVSTLTQPGLDGTPRAVAWMEYDAMGRIKEIEQACVDAGEPPLIVQCQYGPGEQNAIKKIGGAKKEDAGAFNFIVEIEGITSGSSHGRPDRVCYTSPTTPQLNVDMKAEYDRDGNLTQLDSRREHDHIGQFNLAYDTQGRILLLRGGEDNDCDGIVEEKEAEAVFMYDDEGRLERIHDTLTDQDLFTRTTVIIDAKKKKEEMTLRAYIGEDITETLAVTVTDDDVDKKKKMLYEVEAAPQLMLEVPYDPALPVTVRDVNWWGDLIASVREAKMMWGTYYPDFGSADMLQDSIVTPILNESGNLAMTMTSDQLSVCLYSARGRKAGPVAYRGGSTGMELHFYKRDAQGGTLAMLTVDMDGQMVIGIASGAGPELAATRYMHAWACQREAKKKSEPAPRDAWNSTDNPSRFVMPAMAADGSLYIAGLITVDGQYAYCDYQDNDCDGIEGVITVNSPVEITCTATIPGDVNGDCRVNIEDLAILAANWLRCNREPVETCATGPDANPM
jgi:uncharacterized membrane protein